MNFSKSLSPFRFALVAALLLLVAGQTFSQHKLPQRVREYLRINQLQGRKPSTVAEMFPSKVKYLSNGKYIPGDQMKIVGIHEDTIFASAYGDGTISPSDTVIVPQDSSATFTFSPFSGNILDSIVVDGINVGVLPSFTINDIVANHTISAYFGIDSSITVDSTTFTPTSISFPGVWAGYSKWFDYNNDGQVDAVVMGPCGPYDTNYVAKIYQNTGGVFTDINAAIRAVGNEEGVAWGDYDNDGSIDLFVTGSTSDSDGNPVATLYRNVNGIFVADTVNHFMGLQGTAAFVDYDNDGQLDLFYTGSPDNGQTFYSKLY